MLTAKTLAYGAALTLMMSTSAYAVSSKHFDVSRPELMPGLSVQLDLPIDKNGERWKKILNNSNTTIAEFLHTSATLAAVDIEVKEVEAFFDTDTLKLSPSDPKFIHSPEVIQQLKQRYSQFKQAGDDASRILTSFKKTQVSGKAALRFQVQSQYFNDSAAMRVTSQADYLAFMHDNRYVYVKMADEAFYQKGAQQALPMPFPKNIPAFYDYKSSMNSIKLKY